MTRHTARPRRRELVPSLRPRRQHFFLDEQNPRMEGLWCTGFEYVFSRDKRGSHPIYGNIFDGFLQASRFSQAVVSRK